MKRIKLVLLILVAVCAVGCQAMVADTINNYIELSTEELEFSNIEGSKIISITTNSNWSVINPCQWIEVTPNEGNYGDDQEIEVAVTKNSTPSDRTYLLIFESGTEQDSLLVIQRVEAIDKE